MFVMLFKWYFNKYEYINICIYIYSADTKKYNNIHAAARILIYCTGKNRSVTTWTHTGFLLVKYSLCYWRSTLASMTSQSVLLSVTSNNSSVVVVRFKHTWWWWSKSPAHLQLTNILTVLCIWLAWREIFKNESNQRPCPLWDNHGDRWTLLLWDFVDCNVLLSVRWSFLTVFYGFLAASLMITRCFMLSVLDVAAS